MPWHGFQNRATSHGRPRQEKQWLICPEQRRIGRLSFLYNTRRMENYYHAHKTLFPRRNTCWALPPAARPGRYIMGNEKTTDNLSGPWAQKRSFDLKVQDTLLWWGNAAISSTSMCFLSPQINKGRPCVGTFQSYVYLYYSVWWPFSSVCFWQYFISFLE